jgi:glycosyltransferase involved in cell wall biosynthesis
MMDSNICKHILIVGPDYIDAKGGIGAVIDSYKKQFPCFNFISTYRYFHKLVIPFYSIYQLLSIPIYLLIHREIKIVHIHGASRGSFFRKYIVFLISKYLFTKKVIYHIHGGEFHIFYANATLATKKLIRHLIENADCIACLSKQWETFFVNNFQPKRIKIIPNFIDETLILKTKKATNEKVTFLFLGKIVKGKGIYDLLNTIKILSLKADLNFELWIGGNGEIENLKKYITLNKLNEHIKFLGWISGNKKQETLRCADVYVLPSYNEGMPVSIIESMAQGLPVIATNVGGIPELVLDGESGLLIEPGDTLALFRSMETLIKNHSLIEEMGRKSITIIENGYSSTIAMKIIESTYIEILNSN